MPIYEYVCDKCRETFSLLQKVGTPLKDCVCPKCGSGEIRKKLSAFSCSCSGSGPSSSFPSSGFGGGG